jgi:RNA polymerase sigma-70 factor (ECF subfamily)
MATTIQRSRFEALVHAHHAAVYRSAHRVLRSQAGAEDAAQEVFLRVLDGRLVVPAGSSEEARRVLVWWAVRVAWNTHRSEARRGEREGRHAMEHDATKGMPQPTLDDDRLWRLVDDLADELRVPLLLRFVEGITFARIGEALGIGESAAHERVAKALDRLRLRAGAVGLGAVVPHLEVELAQRLPRAAAAESLGDVPGGLAARLNALEAGRATASVGASGWSLSSVGLTSLAATAALVGVVGSTDAEVPLHPPVDSVAQRTATVEGRVVDAAGAGLADVDVVVSSIEREGKLAKSSAKARTDVNGWYRADVAVAHADGANYTAEVTGRTHRGVAPSPEVRLAPGRKASLEPLIAEVRTTPIDLGFPDGIAFGPGGDPNVASSGGAVITGVLQLLEPLDDRPMSEQITIHARIAPRGDWAQGQVAADGTFTIPNVPPGVHRVFVSPEHHRRRSAEEPFVSSTWFDVEIRAGEASSSGHDVILKRATDPRDVGHHAAELHGLVVARATGEPVDVDVWALDLDSGPELDPVEFRRDWLPNHLFPAPVQRMMMGPEPKPSPHIVSTGLEAGHYLLRCNRRGFASYVSEPFTLSEREIRSGVRVELEASCSVAGQVLGSNGAPLEGAFVLVTGFGPVSDSTIAAGDEAVRSADGRGYLHINGSEERTQPGGAFELNALPSGLELRLVALHPEYAPVFGARFVLGTGEARKGDELRFGAARAR